MNKRLFSAKHWSRHVWTTLTQYSINPILNQLTDEISTWTPMILEVFSPGHKTSYRRWWSAGRRRSLLPKYTCHPRLALYLRVRDVIIGGHVFQTSKIYLANLMFDMRVCSFCQNFGLNSSRNESNKFCFFFGIVILTYSDLR